MKRKLVYIGFAFKHHKGDHAGYHHVKEYINYDYVIDTQKYVELLDSSVLKDRILCKLKKVCYLLKCSLFAIFKGNVTFHFIYGENNFVPFPFMHFRGSKVVVTFHQPFSWFKDNSKWLDRLQKIDEIILVGNSEIQLFRDVTQKDNVHFFPHGICTDFYKPQNCRKKDMVLMVGNWLRDFTFASKIFAKLEKVSPHTEVIVVTNKMNHHYFESNKNVKVLSGITDQELCDLYRKTSCLFLPLQRFTANNALLEAASVGCNILIATDFADNSYIPNDYLSICPINEDMVIKKMTETMNLDVNYDLAEYVKENYSWSIVANDLKHFLLK